MNKMRLFLSLVLTILYGVLSPASPVRAESWRIESGDFKLAKEQVIEGDLFFAGERVEIDGVIRGDLVLISESATINGRVEGSVLGAVSGKLSNNGLIGGSVRGFINEAYLSKSGVIKGSISALAFKLITERGSTIEKGVLGRFSEADLKGKITGPVSITSAIATKVGGRIDGDFQVGGGPIKWVSPLTIAGKVSDATGYDNNPAKLKGIRVNGGYHQQKPMNDQTFIYKGVAVISFIWFLGSLLTSLVLYRLFPRTAWNITEPTIANFRRSLLIGLIGLVGLPILIIILAITIVGIPLAILLGIFYLILFLFSGIPLNLWAGRLIFKSKLNPVLMIILGGLILALISFFPIVSILVHPFLLVIGMGMIIGNIRLQVNQKLNTNWNA